MRQRTRAKSNRSARVTKVPWTVAEVRPLPRHRLFVRFVEGTAGEVDLAPMIFGPKAGVFTPLRDEARFAEVRVTDGAVTWPGDLDIAPDAMYDNIRAHGRWTVRRG